MIDDILIFACRLPGHRTCSRKCENYVHHCENFSNFNKYNLNEKYLFYFFLNLTELARLRGIFRADIRAVEHR